jgi:hypothetical protein
MSSRRLVLGMAAITLAALLACGGAAVSTNESATSSGGTATNGPSLPAGGDPDAGWDNGCSPLLPIRYYVNNTDHEDPTPLHDACEPLPPECKPDAAIDEPRDLDSKSTCECVQAVKGTKNDAGHTSCPGNGPIYCDVLEDGSLRVRCSPP